MSSYNDSMMKKDVYPARENRRSDFRNVIVSIRILTPVCFFLRAGRLIVHMVVFFVRIKGKNPWLARENVLTAKKDLYSVGGNLSLARGNLCLARRNVGSLAGNACVVEKEACFDAGNACSAQENDLLFIKNDLTGVKKDRLVCAKLFTGVENDFLAERNGFRVRENLISNYQGVIPTHIFSLNGSERFSYVGFVSLSMPFLLFSPKSYLLRGQFSVAIEKEIYINNQLY